MAFQQQVVSYTTHTTHNPGPWTTGVSETYPNMSPFVTIQQQVVSVNTTQSSSTWTTDLCDCCSDMGICCCAMWCFPCLQCQTVSQFGWCFCMPLLDCCMIVSCCFRSKMRERYRIQGSCCEDCCTLCFCFMCAWCQMSREIKMRNHTPVSTVVTQQIRA